MTTTSTKPNPTKPNPTKPNPTKPNPTQTGTPKRAITIAASLLIVGVLIALIVAFAAGGDDAASSTTVLDSRIPQGEARQVSFANVAGTALPRHEPGVIDNAVGMEAPAFTASYFDNAEVTIDPADGTPRVFMFLAHWCPHCQAEVIAVTDWMAENGVPTDIEVVAISTNVDQGAPNYPPSTWLLRENWPLPVLRDSAQDDLAAGYGLSGFPFIVAVDGDGKVVSRSSGELPAGQWETILASVGATTASST